MRTLTPADSLASEFAFRFDSPIQSLIIGGELEVTGWLVDLAGRPIYGIRAVLRRRLRGKTTIRARRKRNRPEVAAAYPDIPDAKASGFLVELKLPLGRTEVSFQVLDHGRVWRTFHTASVAAFPLAFLSRVGLRHTRRCITPLLQHLFASKTRSEVGTQSTPWTAAGPRSIQATAPKRVELFATSKSNLFILEIGELIAAGFAELGCEAALHLDRIPEEDPGPDTLRIVVTPHEYYNLFLAQQIERRRARELTRNLILLCTEQPETIWFQSNLQWGIYARALADINPLGVAAYASRGLRCHHMQLGYHPSLAPEEPVRHNDRANEIVFLGSLTERRDEFFAEHADFFSRHRCHIRLVPLGFAKTKATKSYLSAEARNQLLSNSKILLNVHYSEQKYFEWHRMLVGLANGCCVITETCEGYGPLVPGKHFVMVEPEFLIPCCEYYLAHPDECARITDDALSFLRDHLRQSQGCAAFLDEIAAADALEKNAPQNGRDTARLQPLPSGDSPPAPLPRALAMTLTRHTAGLLARAIRDDATELFHRFGRDGSAQGPRRLELTAPDEATKQGVIAKREAYRERLHAQTEAISRGDTVMALHDNAAYAQCAAPALTVIVTLFNYAQFIDDCVASVEIAAAGLKKRPVDVVIVNDASTDSSLAAAIRCQLRHDLPIRIVDKKFNTGLADARNTGIEMARAPYVFILDADNLVFPAAFAQLLDAISADDYAAAFSLLCRFRGTPANRVGLLSYYDWDPQVLVQYPYIDAMAMFRRDALIEAGGYNNELSQIGWFGWEDYDLWLHFAHNGHKVAFVPNILCLYRHHERSMINTTNLFEVDLVNHLVEKYRELVDGFEPREQLFGVERHRVKHFAPATSASSGNSRAREGTT
jgi:glycosyltransferase involved in cell wall biosynthesis